MNFKQLNEIIKNSIITNCNAVESTTINAKICPSELKAFDQNIFWKLEVLILIKKEFCPVNFKELLINISQSSYLLLLREELGKYFKGML